MTIIRLFYYTIYWKFMYMMKILFQEVKDDR